MDDVQRLAYCAITLMLCSAVAPVPYEATWESLDSRPLPGWFDNAKVGIMLTWGVYSVPAIENESFWYYWRTQQYDNIEEFMRKNYASGITYQDLAKDFTAELYNANDWVELFKNAGAKYVILTAKHRDGFNLWPSPWSFSWNSVDVGPGKDIVGELANATKQADLHFGVYYSLSEWYHPLYLADERNEFKTQDFVNTKCLPELQELVTRYKPDVLWSDGEFSAPDAYWSAPKFLAWLYNESPVKDSVLVNDRWGANKSSRFKHGDFFTGQKHDNATRSLVRHKWEKSMSLDIDSYGYRRVMTLHELVTSEDLISTLVQVVSGNGNLLINVGPRKDGTIDLVFQERLYHMGHWLETNGEAIYDTGPWLYQNDTVNSNVWYTSKGDTVFAIILEPSSGPTRVTAISSMNIGSESEMTILGSPGKLKYESDQTGTTISVPALTRPENLIAIAVKITGIGVEADKATIPN